MTYGYDEFPLYLTTLAWFYPMRLLKIYSSARFLYSFLAVALLVLSSVAVADDQNTLYQARAEGLISVAEVHAIDRACRIDYRLYGPAEYYRCISDRLSELEIFSEKPDLSVVSDIEGDAIERACGISNRIYGPAVYYRCISKQLSGLIRLQGKPDLSGVSPFESGSIEESCGIDKRLFGPANFYSCIRDRLSELKMLPVKPDLSRFSQAENDEIERLCGLQKRLYGPARFYRCIEMHYYRIISPRHPEYTDKK